MKNSFVFALLYTTLCVCFVHGKLDTLNGNQDILDNPNLLVHFTSQQNLERLIGHYGKVSDRDGVEVHENWSEARWVYFELGRLFAK